MNNTKEKLEFSENKISIKMGKLVEKKPYLKSLIMRILCTSDNTIEAEYETNSLVFQLGIA